MPSARPRHTAPGTLPWLSPAPLLSGFRVRQKKRWVWSGSKRVLQSCLNIAQGNRNAGQGSEQSKNNTGLTAHSLASLPSLQPDAGQAEQAGAVPEPSSVPGARLGRDVVYCSPQAPSAALGLGPPLALEIQKSMSKGVAMAPGECWGSAGSSSLCTSSQQEPGAVTVPDPGGGQGVSSPQLHPGSSPADQCWGHSSRH